MSLETEQEWIDKKAKLRDEFENGFIIYSKDHGRRKRRGFNACRAGK